MWKIAFCLLVLVVCMELSTADHHGKHSDRKQLRRPGKTWKKKAVGDYGNKEAENYMKASNPEMMMMMRMKKMLSPFRKFMTEVKESEF